ncbi:MAG: DNA polymerase III subunit alpha [Bacteroidetes bacterium ADurb.Bin123]|nr:MAG: DNA polymerase III subunit alpha [Bacteroidetes bacterium ADurb.Bin123]
MYLNCHSYFSLCYGTLSVERLVEEAVRKGVRAMALTDINNSTGILDFVKVSAGAGIKPLAGIEFRNGQQMLYTGIARNNEGFYELNDFLSRHLIEKKPFQDMPPFLPNAWFIFPFGSRKLEQFSENEFLGVRMTDLNRLRILHHRSDYRKMVVWAPVTFGSHDDYLLHRHLRAIDQNILLSKLTRTMLASSDEHFLSEPKLTEWYADFPELLQNARQILDQGSISFEYGSVKNKQTFTGSRYDDKVLLEKLALDGWKYRYGNNGDALERVRHELEIIDRLGFSSYFLITWDIIRYSMGRGFYHVGRGSGANSVVAYCLRITDVDPIELNLYFERFINPKRSSPPDFDIDFSWRERDEVQDYIFKRYGLKYTALLGTITTFQGRSTLRELGKVYGLPKNEIDMLVNEPENNLNESDLTRRIFHIGSLMENFPNNRSIHAGGILISEKPINYYTALDMPPKGFQTTQWDMYVAESIGFEKIDILSQRGIGHIRESVEIIRKNRKLEIDIHRIQDFKTDEQVKKQLKSGETIGCFYIESPAMRGLLKKLRCDDYITLVAASSIIRPGVAKSGMMREYIRRFHDRESINYLHPVMKEQLEETFGVMVYQEDVLKVCHHFAGLDLADADVLRRAMSGKYRSRVEFQKIVEKFHENCNRKGYPAELTSEVWRQIESFAGYSFSKAHSASYAVESFQSLYLKSRFPLEFMVAVINNFGGFYQTWVYVNEARRCGATIELPCVNHSDRLTTIEGKNVYLGLALLSGLEEKTSGMIVDERCRFGEFHSLDDFVSRVPLTKEQITLLIRIGALRFTGKPKARLLWEVHMLLTKRRTLQVQHQLFTQARKSFELPPFEEEPLEAVYDELELLGFPVTMTFFDMLQTTWRNPVHAGTLSDYDGGTIKLLGLLVTIKYVRTSRAEIMHFGCFLDQYGEFFDTVHFPDSLRDYPFKGMGVYLLLGKVTTEFGHPTLEVRKMAKMPLRGDPREK